MVGGVAKNDEKRILSIAVGCYAFVCSTAKSTRKYKRWIKMKTDIPAAALAV